MKTLLLLSRVTDLRENSRTPSECVPISESQALRAALTGQDHDVDVLDGAALACDASLLTCLVRRLCGPDAALAVLAFRRRREYDVVFSDGEQVALPLAMLFRTMAHRPAHVSVAQRLTQSRARWLFPLLGLRRSFDALFVYTQAQRDFAEDCLGILGETVSLISPQVDDHFFRPSPAVPVSEDQAGVAGRQGHVDPALCEAVAAMPELTLNYTPYTREQDEEECEALRDLYARSSFVIVPLDETDSAGAATILQAMAMGKAVIATHAEGQTDIIVEGVTGLTVLPGDVEGWRRTLTLLRTDRALRERLGHNARRWVEEHAAQDRWARRIAETVRMSTVAPEASLSEVEMRASTLHSFH